MSDEPLFIEITLHDNEDPPWCEWEAWRKDANVFLTTGTAPTLGRAYDAIVVDGGVSR